MGREALDNEHKSSLRSTSSRNRDQRARDRPIGAVYLSGEQRILMYGLDGKAGRIVNLPCLIIQMVRCERIGCMRQVVGPIETRLEGPQCTIKGIWGFHARSQPSSILCALVVGVTACCG